MNNQNISITYEQEKLIKEAILTLVPDGASNPYYDIHESQGRGDVTDRLFYRENELLLILKAILEHHEAAKARESYFYEPVLHSLSKAGIQVRGGFLVYPDALVLKGDLSEV